MAQQAHMKAQQPQIKAQQPDHNHYCSLSTNRRSALRKQGAPRLRSPVWAVAEKW